MKKLTFLFLVLLLTACSKAAPKATATLAPSSTSTPVTPATPTQLIQQASATSVPAKSPTLAPTTTPTPAGPTLAPTVTFTPGPTNTPAPTDTPIVLATATSVPPLAAQGPYLVYLSTRPEGGKSITMLNPDGNGRKDLPLPENAFIPDVHNAVSPDGAWVSFYLGNPGQINAGQIDAASGPFTLTLNLMSLADGTTRQVASLLSADYPGNFLTAAAQAIEASPDLYKGLTPEQVASNMTQAFLNGIYNGGWSASSTYLAYAAETEGPTSDLYVYTPANGKTRRLSNEVEEIQWLTWSSDNLHILFGTANEVSTGVPKDNFRVVRVDGAGATSLGQLGYRSGWATASLYTVYSANQAGTFVGLTNVNILTKQKTVIWAYAFVDFAFDLKDGSMVVLGFSGEGAAQQTGVYLQDTNWGFTPLNATNIFPRGGNVDRFVASSSDKGVVGIAITGTLTTIRDSAASISISPNWNWMVLFDPAGKISGIELYDNKDALVKQLTDITPNRIIWRASSAGLFIRNGADLYYIAVPDGKPILIDKNVAVSDTGDFNNFVWVK